MRISTFRNRKAKDDHTDQVPVTEFVKNIEELNYIQRNVAWAPAIFDGWRGKDHWKSAQLLVLDIDDGDFDAFKKTLEHTKEECLITFTESHRKIKNGKLQKDCFRATFFLKEETSNKDAYKQTLIELQERYAEFGTEQNPDIAKYFWTSTGVSDYVQTYFPGKKIPLSKIKKIKEQTVATKTDISKIPIVTEFMFMKESDLENRRNDMINKVSYIMASHGYDVKEIKELIFSKKLERPLDDRYNKVIEDAYESGKDLLKERLNTFGENFFKNMGADEFFEEFILSKNMSCELNGMISFDNKIVDDDFVIDNMIISAVKYKLKSRSKDVFKSFLSVWKANKIEKIIKDIKETIRFKEPNDEICKLIQAITGRVHPLDVAVMRHWIWSIKNKFNKRKVKHHIMPILYGKTRSGKTTAINKLLEPINGFHMNADLTVMNDSRHDHNLLNKLVIFFDELGKADKVVVSNLKLKITADTITYRKLGLNQNIEGFNMCSFIGATNEPVKDSIVDPTSTRRYHEIHTLDKCDWSAINSIDYAAIWTSVNEEDTMSPIEPFIHELSIAQEDIRAKDYVEEFLEYYSYKKPENVEDGRFIETEELYIKCMDWLKMQNKHNYAPKISKFSSRIKSHLGESCRKWVASKKTTKWGYYIDKSCIDSFNVIESSSINLSKEN